LVIDTLLHEWRGISLIHDLAGRSGFKCRVYVETNGELADLFAVKPMPSESVSSPTETSQFGSIWGWHFIAATSPAAHSTYDELRKF
jgi:hypothetical protein